MFGEHGYKKASIEQIIKEANISKGSLFYYFESKKNFYLYLYEYCAKKMEEIIDHPGPNGTPFYLDYTDFFERLYVVQQVKMKHSKDYPHMYSFMKKVIFETAPEIKFEIMKINQRYTTERFHDYYKNLDLYKFKEGIDIKMVVQLVAWCSEGSANLINLKHKLSPNPTNVPLDFKEILEVFQSYMNLLKNNFYKEEYL